ncbi:Cytochrome c oxidase assembly protein COX11, mitochondrial [Hondaea fermentalgiana]|uniref:Cytochrome c oxidase assembly protein COX11, mitochondrial n=1 Tax=Hondaea fermentalgiana TaxID=2315210 RepID=A0A2R5GGC3_9STRA|nr:Cytochrome c oxidase assembly protein COX11, mitochondrial [Hondaea fermentalgiana]|eukprot:GBG27703.1 Cytochrome c oxidase assembly protein COX11, mitochondrial [Hondaea fermentalgiana]
MSVSAFGVGPVAMKRPLSATGGARRGFASSSRSSGRYDEEVRRKNATGLVYMLSIVVAAVGLSYTAVPLYKVFCQVTGYGGTTRQSSLDKARSMQPVPGANPITVKFTANTADSLGWKFKPQQSEVRVVPGETALAFYTATNNTDEAITGVASYNITPTKAGIYFNKIQCFCFDQQRLKPNEEVDMPVFFYIDPTFADDPQMAGIDNIGPARAREDRGDVPRDGAALVVVLAVAISMASVLKTTSRAARVAGDYERPDPPLRYTVNLDTLDEKVRALWVPLDRDEETEAFLQTCQANVLRDGVASVLRSFMSRTDANGLTGRGKMFVLSNAHLARVCPNIFSPREIAMSIDEPSDGDNGEAAPGPTAHGPRRLLDIGSGDGSITESYAGAFDEVVTTETSSVMASKLRARGWGCYEPGKQPLPTPTSNAEKFDLITCFNVLDRADQPLTLLRDLKARLKPGTGRLVLAVVLPWCPFVESGTRQLAPSEILPMEGARCRDKASFEESLEALALRVLQPEGFRIRSISRVPYISQGDSVQRYYVLSDAIIVCDLPLEPQL